MGPRGARARAVAAALLLGVSSLARGGAGDGGRQRRLDALQQEIARLRNELAGLVAREKTLLDEVATMDAEIALRRAEVEDVTLRLAETEERLAQDERTLGAIAADRDRRAPKLAARLREIYKRGAAGWLARAVLPAGDAPGLDGLRYAAYLSRRDGVQLAAWRELTDRLARERTALARERERLSSLQAQAREREARLDSGLQRRRVLLDRVRGDRAQHERAVTELEEAARSLGKLVESMEGDSPIAALDVRAFRGLLDWPASGRVSAKFGTVVHPRFRTEVPHPGLDIEAAAGDRFRSVFDGRVAYAAPLTGYGLTCVVEHGHGVVSVYAHAMALVVSAGEVVTRGQELGRVGDSGSLRGPCLYFEVREGGKPVDPMSWLRGR